MAGDRREKNVGFINAVSNETRSVQIPFLEVLPEYKRRGIGSKLVELMFASLDGHNMIDIVCDEDVIPFYNRFDMYKILSGTLRKVVLKIDSVS